MPAFRNLLRTGQKTPICSADSPAPGLQACIGWNTTDARCDVDVSVFMLGAGERVPSEDWFVFYSQPRSPDGALAYSDCRNGIDRKQLDIDLRRIDPRIEKMVFVLTIDEALEQRLNFSFVKDVYLRLLNPADRSEIFSYRLPEMYDSVISMTIGELYRKNGQWRFNPIGNGIGKDLSGQCAMYGVEIM